MKTQKVGKSKKYSFKDIRSLHLKAYEKWAEEDDYLLTTKFLEGENIQNLSKLLKRKKGAITSRIRKLDLFNLQENLTNSGKEFFSFGFPFTWEPVFSSEKSPYFFPNPITSFMRETYNKASVYRWNIYKKSPLIPDFLYIGMCNELCPNRLKNYLSPTKSQKTSSRINNKLNSFISEKYFVQLETLQFNKISISNNFFVMDNLKDKHIRIMIESMMVAHYKLNGTKLLNL